MLPPQKGHFERKPKEILEHRNQDWIMDFKQIEAFINVMQYGSFSKAADATLLALSLATGCLGPGQSSEVPRVTPGAVRRSALHFPLEAPLAAAPAPPTREGGHA